MNLVRKGLVGRGGAQLADGGMRGGWPLDGTPAHPGPIVASLVATAHHGIQLGIDVDAYTYKGQDIPVAARAVAKYALSLHANAISLTFPFFMNGPHAPTVTKRQSTPAPHEMAVITRIAEAQGLYVVFRPLLDETSIDREFRGNMKPSHPAKWFASYRRFLLPYARVAQRSGAQEFVVAPN